MLRHDTSIPMLLLQPAYQLWARRISPRASGQKSSTLNHAVPVGPTAGVAASYIAVQLRRGPRTACGPGWVPRPAAPRGACGSVPVMRSC